MKKVIKRIPKGDKSIHNNIKWKEHTLKKGFIEKGTIIMAWVSQAYLKNSQFMTQKHIQTPPTVQLEFIKLL